MTTCAPDSQQGGGGGGAARMSQADLNVQKHVRMNVKIIGYCKVTLRRHLTVFVCLPVSSSPGWGTMAEQRS